MGNTTADDGWALRADLELCGAVRPPAYAELNTDAHLNTFDVGESGHAVLLSDCGRLFLLNLFQPPSAKKATASTASTPSQQDAVRLLHLELDPPLQKHEVREVEAVKVNAATSSVLLVARTWIKVVRIPTEATQLLNRHVPSSSATDAPSSATTASGGVSKLAVGDAKRALLGASRTSHQHFLVRFEDSTSESVTLDVSPNASHVTKQQVEKRLTAHKRVASISREVYCASIRQVGYFNRVCHAAWHPLSDAHVVVLSDGEELSVFNLSQDVAKPEQRHVLDFRGMATDSACRMQATSASSVAFCFGSSQMLWEIFTIYLLRSDGSIYALCPIVPFDTRVHATVLETLKSEVDGQLMLCREKMQDEQSTLTGDKSSTKASTGAALSASLTSLVAELKSQKYWLQEAWAPAAPSHASPPALGISRHDEAPTSAQVQEYYRCLRPHVSGISPETWPLAIQGPVDLSPHSVIAGKNNLPGGSAAASLLSVPYAVKTDDGAMGLSPFLLRSFTSGHVELLLLDSPVRPQWKTELHEGAHPLPALLLECLNLGVDDSGGLPLLARDTSDPRLVYCFHSTGVHVLNVSWVFALVAGKAFATLPKSSVRHIFGVSPSAKTTSHQITNVIGARVLKNVYVGHLLLLRLASGSFEVVNVSAASSELIKGVLDNNEIGSPMPPSKSLPETLASRLAGTSSSTKASTASLPLAGVTPFSEMAAEKIEALSARGIRVTGKTKQAEVHEAMLAFVIERIKILHEDVEYVDVMDQLIKDRVRLLVEMVQAQNEKETTVQQSLQTAQTLLKALQAKVEKAMHAQQNLRKRAAAVLQAIKENQPMLSRAERQYKQELEHMSIEVRRMKPRVTQLTVSGQRMVHNLEHLASAHQSDSASANRWRGNGNGGTLFSDEKKKMCYDVLRAESQLIDDAKTLVDDITTNLQHLQQS